MRLFSELPKQTRNRLREFIRMNPTTKTEELSTDLNLRVMTVAAVRANITRELTREFERVCNA